MNRLKPIHFFFFIVLICCTAIFFSCHKSGPYPYVEPYIAGITVSGCQYAGNEISFSLQYAGSGTYYGTDTISWNFGDGSTSTATNTKHTYASPGAYNLILTVNNKVFTKNVDIAANAVSSPYTINMAGVRNWHVEGYGRINELNVYAEGSAPDFVVDTQFNTEVVNEAVVKLPFYTVGLTLNLVSDDPINKVLTFAECTANTMSLKYYYAKDSIVYTNNWHSSTGYTGYEELIMHTY